MDVGDQATAEKGKDHRRADEVEDRVEGDGFGFFRAVRRVVEAEAEKVTGKADRGEIGEGVEEGEDGEE